MKIQIQNGSGLSGFEVRPADFVAALKDRYISSSSFVGNPQFVTLVHKGRVLDDLHRICDYGIHTGDTIAHVSSVEAMRLLQGLVHGHQGRGRGGLLRGGRGGNSKGRQLHLAGQTPLPSTSPTTSTEAEAAAAASSLPIIDYHALAQQLTSLSDSTDVLRALGGTGTGQAHRVPAPIRAPLLYPFSAPVGGEEEEGVDTLVPVLVSPGPGGGGGVQATGQGHAGGAGVVYMPLSELRELMAGGGGGTGSPAGPTTTTTTRPEAQAGGAAPGQQGHTGAGTQDHEEEDAVPPFPFGLPIPPEGVELPSGFHEPGIAPGARAELARLRAARRAQQALIPLRMGSNTYLVPYGSIFADGADADSLPGHGPRGYGAGGVGGPFSHGTRQARHGKGGAGHRTQHVVSEVRCGPAGHAFRVLHRMEGRWSGDAEMLLFSTQGQHGTGTASVAGATAATAAGAGSGGGTSSHSPLVTPIAHGRAGPAEGPGQEHGGGKAADTVRVVSSTLTWDDYHGCWHEGSTITAQDGLSSYQGVIFTPIGDGVCKVELAGMRDRGAGGGGLFGMPWATTTGAGLAGGLSTLAQGDLDMRLREVVGPEGGGHMQAGAGSLLPSTPGTCILLLTATSRTTGLPVLVETIILGPGDMKRVRTVQRFAQDGTLAAVYTVREARVLDTLTGAMETLSSSHYGRAGHGLGVGVGQSTSERQGRRGSADEELYAELSQLAGRDPRVASMIRAHRAKRAAHGSAPGSTSGAGSGLAYILGRQVADEEEEYEEAGGRGSPEFIIDLTSLPLESAAPSTSTSGPAGLGAVVAGLAAALQEAEGARLGGTQA